MSDDSPLETIARHLTEIKQSIFNNDHDGWKSDDALSLLGRIREIAAYLNEPDGMAPTGSLDDYAMLVGLEIRQDIIVNAHRLVIELIGASLADDIQRLALDTEGALIRASDQCGRSLAALARANIAAARLIN